MNSGLYFGAVCWSGNINNQDRTRQDTFIRKANGTVKMEWVTDHGQSTEDFWQMTPTHSDLNLTAEGLTAVRYTELHALEPHTYYQLSSLNRDVYLFV